uniref:DNA-directed RNA polymerase subunit gamma n=1 Tax=Cyanoptyche gloeocystis TaxID=77922 RepID=A0A3G1IWA0_9EUKA|nr:RNA polymerase beta' subunit [Cyanoptyche gloeocystis]
MLKYEKYFNYIKIHIASPDRIRQWGERISANGNVVGKITKPETINYRTLKPEKDGLFCERIFGPIKDNQCQCGRSKIVQPGQSFCSRCGMEITESRVRRYRMGYIQLSAVVAHIWYLKNRPSYISNLLNMKVKEVEQIIYLYSFVVLKKTKEFENKKMLNHQEWVNIHKKRKKKNSKFEVPELGMGAEVIEQFLKELNIEWEIKKIREDIEEGIEDPIKHSKYIRRLRVIRAFINTEIKAEWMILSIIPVLPPDLRPMVELAQGLFATSDLNELYRRTIYRNNRLIRLQEASAPQVVIRNEKRMLQEAVDALIDNGRRGSTVLGFNNRPLKSLSAIIKGKQGRFRQNLLGKRVDYSGRSVIVVEPQLKLYQCGLPFEMAIELFQPFLIHGLIKQGLTTSLKIAKKLIESNDPIIKYVLEDVIQGHPVLLNRAPTLHRMSIQAFEPILIDGRAIQLHPLVCAAFNADFDGDQMAVHVPLSVEARAEAKLLMLSSNNLLSPATGDPIITPTQDMVLGCYYLTVDNPQIQKGVDSYFLNMDDVIMAYEQNKISLHAKIWVRCEQILDLLNNDNTLLKVQVDSAGITTKIYPNCRLRYDKQGNFISQYIRTTAGRIIFNKIIEKALCC